MLIYFNFGNSEVTILVPDRECAVSMPVIHAPALESYHLGIILRVLDYL